jgi:hypothetical protein
LVAILVDRTNTTFRVFADFTALAVLVFDTFMFERSRLAETGAAHEAFPMAITIINTLATLSSYADLSRRAF